MLYQRRGMRNRLKQVVLYRVNLCVVLIEEKNKKAAPTRSILCATAGTNATTTASISGSGGGVS